MVTNKYFKKRLINKDDEEFISLVRLLDKAQKNGKGWFNAYQDIDNFLFDELEKKGLEFVTDFKKPQQNTIASIKRLIINS